MTSGPFSCSCHIEVQEKTAKSDPIYRNRLLTCWLYVLFSFPRFLHPVFSSSPSPSHPFPNPSLEPPSLQSDQVFSMSSKPKQVFAEYTHLTHMFLLSTHIWITISPGRSPCTPLDLWDPKQNVHPQFKFWIFRCQESLFLHWKPRRSYPTHDVTTHVMSPKLQYFFVPTLEWSRP